MRLSAAARLAAWAGFLPLLLSAAQPALAAGEAEREYAIKAAYIYNFLQFIDFPAVEGAYTVCVMDGEAARRSFETLKGQRVSEKEIGVVYIAAPNRGDACRVIFVSRSGEPRFEESRGRLAQAAVLTVGESDDFFSQGGMIQLFAKDNKIRFKVNLKAAQTAGLKISSRLLKLADEVKQ